MGLEIERELVVGELSSFGEAGAAGGGGRRRHAGAGADLRGPQSGGAGAPGWASRWPPTSHSPWRAGDLGTRVPLGLEVFLTALAIADDRGGRGHRDLLHGRPQGACLAGRGVARPPRVRGDPRRRHQGGILYLPILERMGGRVRAGGSLHGGGILLAMVIPIRPQFNPRLFVDDTNARLHRCWKQQLSVRSVLDESRSHLEGLFLARGERAAAGGAARARHCQCGRCRDAQRDEGPSSVAGLWLGIMAVWCVGKPLGRISR